MPRVQIVTEQGDVVGEVPVHETNIGSSRNPRFGHGWNGVRFEELWAEARRREEQAAMVAEAAADK